MIDIFYPIKSTGAICGKNLTTDQQLCQAESIHTLSIQVYYGNNPLKIGTSTNYHLNQQQQLLPNRQVLPVKALKTSIICLQWEPVY
jgi:hypothetical protein